MSSGFGGGDRGQGFCGIGGLIEGTGGICFGIEGTGGRALSRGNEAVNGLASEHASGIFLESPHSSGDLIAIMLVGELGALSEIGDDGAEDTRLIALLSGNTVIPHLLVGRAGAGVSRGGVTGETGSDGGGVRVASSTDF